MRLFAYGLLMSHALLATCRYLKVATSRVHCYQFAHSHIVRLSLYSTTICMSSSSSSVKDASIVWDLSDLSNITSEMIIPVNISESSQGLSSVISPSTTQRRTLSSVGASSESNNTVIVLTGATAAGKSSLAMKLCDILDAEIVIADSVQVYKHLDIGSNKPTNEDMVQVIHHLVNICDPNDDESFTAGDFCREANISIRDILSRGKVPIVVGGCTMWVEWLINGVQDNPKGNKDVYEAVQLLIKPYEMNKSWDEAIEVFGRYDPNKVQTLSRNDWYRLSRFIEISIATVGFQRYLDTCGISSSLSLDFKNIVTEDIPKTLGHEEKKTREKLLSDVDVRGIFLSEDREFLYHKIDGRCVDMIEQGLFEEVTNLILDHKLSPKSMGAFAIGYRQTIQYLCRPGFQPNDVKAFVDYIM
jgi:tRNA dimethylallyltransferase